MTLYTEKLLRTGHDYWDRGSRVPIDLFAEMIAAGLDVEALEERNLKEAVNG